jgi:hypothetical protein
VLTSIAVLYYLWLAPHLTDPGHWALLLLFLPVAYLVAHLNAWSHLQIQASRILAGMEDVRAVGPLADALESRDLWMVSGTRALASSALVRLLPRLSEDDGNLLNSRQRQCLYRALDHAGLYDEALTRAVIRAMKLVGDDSAVRPLERLTENRWFIGRNTELQDEAVMALETIRARSVRSPKVLLRAAGAEIVEEELVRPAGAAPETQNEELLRTGVHRG